MALKKAFITAKYNDPDGALGNRWKDGTTEIVLIPNDNPSSGLWTTTRDSDVDSSGGTEHATYTWDIVKHVVTLKVGGFQGDDSVKKVVELNRFNDYKLGQSGDGKFYFRQGVSITWSLTVMEHAGS